MKIVFLHLTSGLVNRGSELVTDLVASELAKKHEVTLIQSGPVNTKKYSVITIPLKQTKFLSSPTNIFDKIRFRRYLDSTSSAISKFTNLSIPFLRSIDPDIVVAINGWPQLQILKKSKIRAKMVVFGHAGIGYHDEDTLRAQPDLFIALSHYADVWAQTIASKKTKIVYIPNPVNLSIYQKAKKSERIFTDPTILVVSALSSYKNIDKVITAVSQTNYSLIIVGEGEKERTLKTLAQRLLPKNRYIFLGNMDPTDIASIYKSVDVFCFVPDKQEAFGRVYLEAMCCKLPIVASDDQIRKDIIGDKGIFVSPTSISSIVDGLHKAVGLKKISYTLKLKEYEAISVCNQISNTFKQLINNNRFPLKIAILHMTLGLVDRGSEISTDMIAEELNKTENVLAFQAGYQELGKYPIEHVYDLKQIPPVAPQSTLDKIKFRLYLDEASNEVVKFTKSAISGLSKFDPDIIIATNGYPQLKIIKKHFPSTKVVVFGRSGIGYHDYGNLMAHPDLFIALSQPAYEWAIKNRRESTEVVMIPNPIDLSIYNSPTLLNLNLPKPIVLVVGALSSYKNIDNAISAVAKTNASLLLVGDGENHDAIAAQLSTFPNDFRWIHHLDPIDLPNYYASSDIFCFVPDPQEAFGRVYLEAMAAGLPIVASNDPVRRQLLGDLGIYVDPHNIDNISLGIIRAMSKGRLDYTVKLKQYNLSNVAFALKKEFHDLIK